MLGTGSARAATATYTQVAVGYTHACGLVSDGTVQCWGDNGDANTLGNIYGELGNGSATLADSSTPVTVLNSAGTAPLSGVTKIGVGAYYTCALLSDKTVQCWGWNNYGELGNSGNFGTSNANPLPAPVTGLANVTDITVGSYDTCAFVSGAAVPVCWGRNTDGALGDGTTIDSYTPLPMQLPATAPVGATVSAVSLGQFHICALLNDGSVWCVGYNAQGELGNGTVINSPTLVKVSLPAGATATAISSGYYHTCALLSDSSVQCWGYNNTGELGDGTTTNRSSPVAVLDSTGLAPLTGVTALSGGGEATTLDAYTCALMSDTTVQCWGDNRYGQLGDGTVTTPRLAPVTMLDGATPPATLTGVTEISAGMRSACTLLSDGSIWCLGDNTFGDLGRGTAGAAASTPALVVPSILDTAPSGSVTAGTTSPAVLPTLTTVNNATGVVAVGALPTGVTMNPDGTITAASTATPGTYSITIAATNATGASTPVAYDLKILPIAPVCTANPATAGASTAVTITCTVSPGTTTTIPGAVCIPSPSVGTSVTCTGTGASLGDNPPVTSTDPVGDTSTGVVPLVISSPGGKDATLPAVPVCTALPNPANTGDALVITCTGGTPNNTLTIPNTDCAASVIPASGTSVCHGTAGTGAGQVNENPPVTVTDPVTNLSNSGVVPLSLNGSGNPALPLCTASPNPAAAGVTVTINCTGGTKDTTIAIPGATCVPSTFGIAGTSVCTGSSSDLGNNPPVTITDPATGRKSKGTVPLVVTGLTVVTDTSLGTTPVPTLGQWGLMLLALLLAGAAAGAVRRRG